MEAVINKTFMRQMYANDSELGRTKLQVVKENLYEVTTKVVLLSIQMYAKKSLSDWVRSDLVNKMDIVNYDLKMDRDDLELGNISSLDITNGCAILNDFLRKDTLALSRNVLSKKIEQKENKKI